MIMEFASLGSLYAYLNNNMTWKERIIALLDISIGLNTLHNNNLVHQDFHPGNLLFNNQKALLITDFGLCKSANQSLESNNNIYGVIDRKSTRLNSSHGSISYAVFCLKKKNKK